MKIFKRIRLVWKGFSQKEKLLSLLFLFLAFWGLVKFSTFLINQVTEKKPVVGGAINYGLWESPKAINPVISQNNETDQELINLIYSALIKEDGLGGFVNDLAKEITLGGDNKTIEVILKDNIYFHDGKRLTADDVIFTANTIKNPVYLSPWQTIFKDVKFEKMGELMIKITLPAPQNNYHHLLTMKIMPKHLWENVDYHQFGTVDLNQKPVGSGPFVISKIHKDRTGRITSILLNRNRNFYRDVFISRLRITFYNSQDEAFADFIKGRLDMLKEVTPYQKDILKNRARISLNEIVLPRYYAVFLNQKSPILSNSKIAMALDMAIDKEALVREVFFNDAEVINAPISKNFLGFSDELNQITFDPQKSIELLSEAGYEYDDAEGLFSKTSGDKKTNLEFTLLLPSINELIHLSDIIKKNWLEIGVKANLQILPLEELYRDYLRNRNYDALLFGQTYTLNPDLYYFWHSSQATNLGLNLSLYKNQSLDSLLELNRSLFEEESLEQNLIEIQESLYAKKPAIFLNNPYYINAYYKKINLPEENIYSSYNSFLSNIDMWYINQKRVLK